MKLNTPQHEMLVAWQWVKERMKRKRSQSSSKELNLRPS